MRILYNLGIRIYFLLILVASVFNPKARQWIRGRRGQLQKLLAEVDPGRSLIWFHCSSLGEFEQGRPLMERIKELFPHKRILLTFYSPSGYEVRKNYRGADHIAYLPLDTHRNAQRFLTSLNIEKAFFVKYEFWYHFLNGLKRRNIPVYLISAIFRKDQVFFRWYGHWYRKILARFDHLFVQQKSSLSLLESIGISHASVSGDTRFDRVKDIADKVVPIPEFDIFCGDSRVVVAGSTWAADESMLIRYINETGIGYKWIIAPHEIHPEALERFATNIRRPVQRYTGMIQDKLGETDILLIDTIGLLSSLYSYAHVSYIGGGFGKGIHNTLEAAVFGVPVIFGPRYAKFQEACDLIDHGAAFSVSAYPEFKSLMDNFLSDPAAAEHAGNKSVEYVNSKLGATARIIEMTMNRPSSRDGTAKNRH